MYVICVCHDFEKPRVHTLHFVVQWEYYVHFLEFNRRLDTWVTLQDLDLSSLLSENNNINRIITSSNKNSENGKGGADGNGADGGGISNGMKRNNKESNNNKFKYIKLNVK